MAIELISTITTKNNGGYAIVLSNEIKGGIHSKSTYEDMLKISNDRLQEGMLCYVVYEKKYYQWVGEKWSAFTINGENNTSGSNETSMYRVETYDEMLLIPTIDLKEGTLCHVKNDVNNMHLYYYNNSIWNGIGTKYQVWIGSTQPPNPNYLWVDTSNFFDENATVDNIPTFIDTSLIQYFKEQILALNNKIKVLQKDLEKAIENGISGDNNSGGNNENQTVIELKSNYLVTEDGVYLITEDGDYIVMEDSEYDEYTPDDEGTVIGGGGSSVDLKSTYLTSEDGAYFITEDGNYFITEDSVIDDNTPDSVGSGGSTIIGGGSNNDDDEELELEDVAYAVKGGRFITTYEKQEIISVPMEQVTIFNESENEITLRINNGELIPLEYGESLSFGDIVIESIIIIEKNSMVKLIGI